MREQEGYHQYQDAAAKLPVQKYPWGTVIANVGGIAAAHALGYVSAGALAKMIGETRLGERFARLHPDAQRMAIGQAIGIAGSVGTVATGLAHMAGQMRVAQEVARLEQEKRQAPSEKVASVYDTYATALAGRRA